MEVPEGYEIVEHHNMQDIREPYDLVKLDENDRILRSWVEHMKRKKVPYLLVQKQRKRILFVERTGNETKDTKPQKTGADMSMPRHLKVRRRERYTPSSLCQPERKPKFNPNTEYIRFATAKFLERGNKIKKLKMEMDD